MRKISLLILLLLSRFGAIAETWPEALSRMPLAVTNVTELNQGNCVEVVLRALYPNATVKAMVFMPGATDEFYMFHRARAILTNGAPTLLDAVRALTNQTNIRVTYIAPILLFHTDEDPIEPLVEIDDPGTARKLKETNFKLRTFYNDIDWDHVLPDLKKYTHLTISPKARRMDSWHFFRHCVAGWNLTNWEAMEAVMMAGKERVRIEKNKLIFEGDIRTRTRPKFDATVSQPVVPAGK